MEEETQSQEKKADERLCIPIRGVIKLNRQSGRHFFERNTKQFFRSKTRTVAHVRNNFAYFVADKSKFEDEHLYDIYMICLKCGNVEKLEGFSGYKKMAQAREGIHKAMIDAVQIDTFEHGYYYPKYVKGDPKHPGEMYDTG
ncbi:unnamed protein product [marine sediment metagenome]|uniref:Uncharacterized protein n=1 Tax=marine sediment metagenome TaxID=412755 RepID=X1JQM3_9ZZZZ